jgi:oxygen-independent coproporphyrinogen-3 oxidase
MPYLGLGPGAHSFRDGVRWWNVRSVEQYCRMLCKGRAPIHEREHLSNAQLRLEALFLGLRTTDGIPLQLLSDSPQTVRTLSTLQASGLVTLADNRIRPTLKGFAVADSLPLLLLD